MDDREVWNDCDRPRQLLIQPAEGRTGVSGDKCRRVSPYGPVSTDLLDRDARKCLDPAEEHLPALGGVPIAKPVLTRGHGSIKTVRV